MQRHRLVHRASRSIQKYVLGIETSCDDTAAAVVDFEGRVYSNIIASQWDILNEWQGIVPNLAARAHSENLPSVIERALEQRFVHELVITADEFSLM